MGVITAPKGRAPSGIPAPSKLSVWELNSVTEPFIIEEWTLVNFLEMKYPSRKRGKLINRLLGFTVISAAIPLFFCTHGFKKILAKRKLTT
jgi:putative effector of murein hydrolase